MRPRYGRSLKRTGAFSSSEAKVNRALELKSRPALAAKATTSREGTLNLETGRTLFVTITLEGVGGLCGVRLFASEEEPSDEAAPPAGTTATSNPASSKRSRSSSNSIRGRPAPRSRRQVFLSVSEAI